MKSKIADISELSKTLNDNTSVPIGIREVEGEKELILLVKSVKNYDKILNTKNTLQISRGVIPFKKRTKSLYTAAFAISFNDIGFNTFLSANNHMEYRNSLTSAYLTIVITNGKDFETLYVKGLPYDKPIPKNKKNFTVNEEIMITKFFGLLGFEKTKEAIDDHYMGRIPFNQKGIDLEKDLKAFSK